MDAVTTVEAALKILQVLAIIGSGALNVYLFLKSARKERVDKVDGALASVSLSIETLETQDQEFDIRLTRIEERMKSMPTHNDLVEIRRQLAEVVASNAAINERSVGVLHAVQSLQKFLMERHG